MAHATLELSIASDLAELASAALFECGAGGIEERGTRRKTRLIVYAADEAGLDDLRRALPGALAARGIAPSAYAIRVAVDSSSDWQTSYFAHLRAVEVAPGFWLRPTHDVREIEGGRVLVYEPAVAFGDGSHVTTRLAARAVVSHCQNRPGARVLDYGTGNGVLALLALAAGASHALGVDVDPRSVAAARRNAELNGFSERARFCLAGELSQRDFDWIVANVEEPALIASAPQIAALAAPRATLVVTGFLAERADAVLAAFDACRFSKTAQSTEDDWALVSLRRGE